jgi:hypothetical protein
MHAAQLDATPASFAARRDGGLLLALRQVKRQLSEGFRVSAQINGAAVFAQMVN